MRNKIIISILFVMAFTISANSQIKVLNNGYVGIGVSNPIYNLDVIGKIHWRGDWAGGLVFDGIGNPWSGPVLYPDSDYSMNLGTTTKRINTLNAYQCFVTSGYYKYSDARLKKNIGNINSPLSKIRKVKGITYNSNIISSNSNLPKNVSASSTQLQFGFVAQDIQKIFPDLVKKADSSEFLAVDYMGLIPVIVEALKEQDSVIAFQNEQIKALQKIIKSGGNLKSANVSTNIETSESIVAAYLNQNAPNPFSQTTEIGYYLPDVIQKAALYIYDMNGTQLKSIPINQKGNGSITINGSELRPGMYMYTLIADGKEIDTKRMILTE